MAYQAKACDGFKRSANGWRFSSETGTSRIANRGWYRSETGSVFFLGTPQLTLTIDCRQLWQCLRWTVGAQLWNLCIVVLLDRMLALF